MSAVIKAGSAFSSIAKFGGAGFNFGRLVGVTVARVAGVLVYTAKQAGRAMSPSQHLQIGTPGYFEVKLDRIGLGIVRVWLSPNAGETGYADPDSYAELKTGAHYDIDGIGTDPLVATITPADGDIVRIGRTTGTAGFFAAVSKDGGSTFTTFGTFSGLGTGLALQPVIYADNGGAVFSEAGGSGLGS